MTDKPLPVYRRTLTGFVPASDEAQAFFERVKPGALVALSSKQPRSLPHSNKYWKLIETIAENCEWLETKAKVHFMVRLLIGHGEYVKGPDGAQFVPDSINFAAMDQAAFNDFYDRALNAICRDIIPGLDPAAVERELGDLLR